MTKIYTKLFEVQKEVKAIEKDSTNPFFNSQYFDINKLVNTLKPLFTKNGLVVLQPLVAKDGRNHLVTQVVDIESGESVDGSMVLPEGLDAQKMGAAITYFRRYSLQSLLFLEAGEDDDGNSVSGIGKPSKVPYRSKFESTDPITTDADPETAKKIATMLVNKACEEEFGIVPDNENDFKNSVQTLTGLEWKPENISKIRSLLVKKLKPSKK